MGGKKDAAHTSWLYGLLGLDFNLSIVDVVGSNDGLGERAVDGLDGPRMASTGGIRSFADLPADGEVAPLAAVCSWPRDFNKVDRCDRC